jgi:hypothetical protein
MRLVPGGRTLKHVIGAGALAPERALRLLGPIAGALDAAHAQGLIHRDIKPQHRSTAPRAQPRGTVGNRATVFLCHRPAPKAEKTWHGCRR